MAETGFTPIQLYRTATASAVPTAGNMNDGELAINTNDGKLFFKNSSGAVTVLADVTPAPAGVSYVAKTANFTVSNLQGVLADTSGGAFTVTLPASPTLGDQVIIADAGGAFGTNNCIAGRNGSTIEGTAADLNLDINGVSVQFVYSGTTWEVYAQVGGNGGNAVTLTGTQTLTNKTLTSPVLNNSVLGGITTTASGNLVVDPATQIVEVKGNGSSVEGQIKLNCHANTHGQTLKSQPHSANVTNTMLLPSGADSTLVSLVSTDTLTNKTLTAPVLTAPVLGTPASGTLSSCTVDGTDEVGFRNIPQNSQSAAYTLVLADAGKHIFHPVADNTARTFTIPANASVAYPVGTAITFINMAVANVTIAITTDTLTLSDAGTAGSRTLATNGSATCIKITSTQWIISGSGLT